MKAYRAMQVIDGKLYSPMAAKIDGELASSNPIGAWTEAEETVFDFTVYTCSPRGHTARRASPR